MRAAVSVVVKSKEVGEQLTNTKARSFGESSEPTRILPGLMSSVNYEVPVGVIHRSADAQEQYNARFDPNLCWQACSVILKPSTYSITI
jgi:hypothetical protein